MNHLEVLEHLLDIADEVELDVGDDLRNLEPWEGYLEQLSTIKEWREK